MQINNDNRNFYCYYSKFDGVERFYISFFGTIFVVLLGFYIAYNMEIKLNKNI